MASTITELRKSGQLTLPNGGKIIREGRETSYQATQKIRIPVKFENDAIEAFAKDLPMVLLMEHLTGLTYDDVAKRFANLTPREFEVVEQMLGLGKKSTQIAAELGISSKTLDIHRQNVGRKLGIKNHNAWGRVYWLFRIGNEFHPEILEGYRREGNKKEWRA